jgi:hypothetical protein
MDKPWAETNEAAIKLVTSLLEKREQRLLDLRGSTALSDFEKGTDRDQYMYCMGRADECREVLMCLGVFNPEMAVKVK